jgi:regulator of RNase E activity RraA
MSARSPLSSEDLDRIRALDTCTASNAIERLNVRLRNEGFIAGRIRCRFPSLPPMVGYAATARIRTAMPPMVENCCCYYDRIDWWKYVASMPEPRVMVFEDMDHQPGIGALIDEIHAAIGMALKCVGCVTNGAVRDLTKVKSLGFQMFSGNVAVSHSYAHVIDFGEPVEIGGLKIKPGDLLHGDLHGVHSIPVSVAREIPGEAAKVVTMERELVGFCSSAEFSVEALAERLEAASRVCLSRTSRPGTS